MPGPGHDLRDPSLLQFLRELALAARIRAERPLSDQHFSGAPVEGDPRPQHFQDQRRRLAGVQAEADDEPAVVIHKSDQVHPPVLAAGHENINRSVCQSWFGMARSDDRTLSGCGRVGASSNSYPASCSTRLTAQGLAPSAGPRASITLIRSQPQSGWACLSIKIEPASPREDGCRVWHAPLSVHESGRAVPRERLLPAVQRVLRDAHQVGKVFGRQPAAQPAVQDQEPLLGFMRPVTCSTAENRVYEPSPPTSKRPTSGW